MSEHKTKIMSNSDFSKKTKALKPIIANYLYLRFSQYEKFDPNEMADKLIIHMNSENERMNHSKRRKGETISNS